MNSLAWLYVTERPDRLDEARRLATRAVELLPESAPVHDTLAWVLFVSGQKADAERHVQRALELAPRPVYHYHLGMIAHGQGKLAVARQALNRALELDPTLPDGDTARATLKLIEDAAQKP
jgi:tetratricopeptide (TPR) repeat protein